MKGERRFVVTMLAPVFVVLVGFYVYPTFFNLYNSFTDLSLLGLRRGGAVVGLDNYARLLTSAAFYRVLWNTAFWLTAVSVALRVALGFGLALLLNSEAVRRYRLVTVSRLILLVPWATPPVVAVALAFLSEEPMKTLPLGLYAFFGQDAADWGAILAASAVTTVPTLILFLPLQRRLAAGLAAGAVKQ
jgi:multiple sugar transport system permease protein